MQREEFKTLVKAMKAVYAQPTFIPDADAFNVWFGMLGDLDYTALNVAVQKYMLTGKFPPTIADLRELATSVVVAPTKPWEDGWEEVLKAIRKYGRYQEDKALDSMSSITRNAVERLGFQELCNSENIIADRANFRMIYEQYEKRERENAVMPTYLRELVAKAQTQIGERHEQLIEKW